MKPFILYTLLIFTISSAFSQIKKPVKWEYSAVKLAPGSYEVKINAKLDRGWHIYSQFTPKGGPAPTKLTFIKNPLLSLSGKINEAGKKEKIYEELFGVDVIQYSDLVTFSQKVLLKVKTNTSIRGNIEYMVCNDNECLPLTKEPFIIALPQ